VLSWLSVMRTVITPRQRSSIAARWTIRVVFSTIRVPARKVHNGLRERLQDLCTPLSLFLMGGIWVISSLLGFALLAWGSQGIPFTTSGLGGFFLLRSAGAGLAALALLSTVLTLSAFTAHLLRITAAYSRRESTVVRLAARATAPPDAEIVLADYLRTGSRDHLDSMFAEWSAWLADVQASHLAFPSMAYMRPTGELCWAKAAVIVLDCAALTDASAPAWAPPNTRPLLAIGSRCLQRLAQQIGFGESRSPVSFHGREGQPFEDSFRIAVKAGLPQERDEDAAAAAFLRSRLRYAPYAIAIAERLLYHDVS
jgi:hypothetical protein